MFLVNTFIGFFLCLFKGESCDGLLRILSRELGLGHVFPHFDDRIDLTTNYFSIFCVLLFHSAPHTLSKIVQQFQEENCIWITYEEMEVLMPEQPNRLKSIYESQSRCTLQHVWFVFGSPQYRFGAAFPWKLVYQPLLNPLFYLSEPEPWALSSASVAEI